MKISGIGFVYMITSPTGRIYVGSAVDVEERWKDYIYVSQCKSQPKLYNSLKKYGPESHTFEIVWAGPIEDMYRYETLIGWGFNVLDRENLNCKLPKLSDKYNSYSEETLLKMSNSQKLRKISDETKLKMSESHLGEKSYWFGKNMSEEACLKMSKSKKGKVFSKEFLQMVADINKIPVLQFDLDGNFIKEWPSAKDAGICVGISNSGITACCKNKPKYKTAGGFKWKYKDEK